MKHEIEIRYETEDLMCVYSQSLFLFSFSDTNLCTIFYDSTQVQDSQEICFVAEQFSFDNNWEIKERPSQSTSHVSYPLSVQQTVVGTKCFLTAETECTQFLYISSKVIKS